MSPRRASLPAFFLLVALLVLLSSPTLAQRRRQCRTAIFRVRNARNNLYALVCSCRRGHEPYGFEGRSVRDFRPWEKDTVAQAGVTVRCFRHRLHHLRRRCVHSSRLFERAATHALRDCMTKRPKRDNGKPFMYKKDRCTTSFRSLPGISATTGKARFETLLVCACRQAADYIVHPGAVQLVTQGAPTSPRTEARFVQKCTRNALGDLGKACAGMPGRFNLRAAQQFNVCCKRARVRFAKSKLQCQDVVPDDVDTVQLSYNWTNGWARWIVRTERQCWSRRYDTGWQWIWWMGVCARMNLQRVSNSSGMKTSLPFWGRWR